MPLQMQNNPANLNMRPKAIWNLAWPQLLMMYVMFFSGIVSIWAAGKIGSDIQASLGLTLQCLMFIMVIIMSISSGAMAAITQSIGMGKITRAKLYILTTVLGSFLLGLAMALPAWILADPILILVQTPENILPLSRKIWHVAILGLPLQYVYSATSVLFRATRQVFPPLFVSFLTCAANFIGCLGFGLGMFGMPDYGFMAIIWTTTISQSLGAFANCWLLRRSGYLRFWPLPTWVWLKKALPYLFRVALPAGAAQIVWQSGYLTLFMLIASLPKDSVNALAGLTAGLRAEALIFMPAMAFNMTCAIITGNCLGMGKPNQARRLGLILTGVAVGLMSVFAASAWPFRTEIAAFLSEDPLTQAQIVNYLSWNLAGTPFTTASQVMSGIMVGAGATQYNLIVNGGSFWVIRIPLGWFLGHKIWGNANGVFAAMVASSVTQALLMLYVVIFVNWQRFAMKKNFK